MKLADIYKSTLGANEDLKFKKISSKDPNVPDNYDPSIPRGQKSKILGTLLKPIDNDDIRYVRVSFFENKIILPEDITSLNKSRSKSNPNKVYDISLGFYKTEMDFSVSDRDNSASNLKFTPATDVYFVFNLTKQVDRVKRKFFQEMLERKGIPYILSDGLEGFNNNDMDSLTARDIRLQGFHEIVAVGFSAFQLNKTETI